MSPNQRSREHAIHLRLTPYEDELLRAVAEATQATITAVVVESVRHYARTKMIEVADPDPATAPRKRGRPRKNVSGG